MENAAAVREGKKISPYMVFFIIHPIQIGVGILSFQQGIVKYAGYDAWIAILIAGMGTHLLLWIIYSLLNRADGDLIKVHRDVFGKWVGGVFSFIFLVYFASLTVLAMRSYAMIVQVWMFHEMGTWFVCLLFLFLAYYTITGGFRVVVGIGFFGFLIPFIGTAWGYSMPLPYLHMDNLLPIWNHSLPDILRSSKQMTLSYLGFGTLLMAYPFIKKPRTSQKWAHAGNGFTMLMYLVIAIISFSYFSVGFLTKTIWPTLSMMKVVELPFLERFEHIFIPIWLLTMLPNVVYTLWVASRGAKRLFKVKQLYVLRVLIVLVFAGALFLPDRRTVDDYTKIISQFAFYFLYGYLPILWVIQFLGSKVRKSS